MPQTKYILVQTPQETLPIVLRTYCKDYVQRWWRYSEGALEHHLFYCVKGKGKIEADNKTFIVNEGDFWFFKRNIPITYYPIGNEFINNYVNFVGEASEMLLNHYQIPNVVVFKSEILKKRFPEIFEHLKNNHQDRASATIYSALVEMGNVNKPNEKFGWFTKALKFINDNYYKDISTNDIASFCGVSESSLFKRFKKEMRTTPVLYINSVRINVSKQYLLNLPNLSIEEISKNVGFESRCYFTKCFKDKVGVTPTQYKKERP